MAKIDAEKTGRENGGLWLGGANTSLGAEALPANQYSWGVNVDNTNGLISTRDGWTPIIRSPNGTQQMMCHFRDSNNVDWVVWAISGRVYASPYPFSQYRDLGVSLKPDAAFFTHCVVERGARRICTELSEGTRKRQVIRPVRYLVIADNYHKPIAWSGGSVACPMTEAPIGQWLAWVNNRLFIGGGNLGEEIHWSDIADPFNFWDMGFLADGGQFRLRSSVRGLCPSPDGNSLLAFEAGRTWRFATGTPIKRESQWKETHGFQSVLFPDIGCLAGKSFVTHYGDLWWWSNKDLMSLRRAAQSTGEDELNQTDLEMTRSRARFGTVKDNVVGVSHYNYLLVNTPSNEIWAKNNSPASLINTNTPPAWLGVWTGFRVTEFCTFTGHATGETYTFALSKDLDNQSRIWKMFNGTQRDAGSPITCSVEFRAHAFGDVAKPKRLRWYDLSLQRIWGNVSLEGFFTGLKGGWKKNLEKEIKASENSFAGEKVLQFRKVFSTENYGEADCDSCGTEGSQVTDQVDWAFQIMLKWTGIMSVDSYRIVTYAEVEQLSGRCEDDETDATPKEDCGNPQSFTYTPVIPTFATPTFNVTPTEVCEGIPGCGSSTKIPDPTDYPDDIIPDPGGDPGGGGPGGGDFPEGVVYEATQTCTKHCLGGEGPAIMKSATATSLVSRSDAEDKAMAEACAAAEAELVCTFTSTKEASASCPQGTSGPTVTMQRTATSEISQEIADNAAYDAAYSAAQAALVCQATSTLFLVGGNNAIRPGTRSLSPVQTDGNTQSDSWLGSPGPNGRVHRIAAIGDEYFIAGEFFEYNGTPTPGLARITNLGVLNPAWNHGPYSTGWTGGYTGSNGGGIRCLDVGVSDHYLAVGGLFNKWDGNWMPSSGGSAINGSNYVLVRPDNGQRVSTLFGGVDGYVLAIKSLTNNQRIIAGNFTIVKDSYNALVRHARPYIACINQDGTLDQTFIGLDTVGAPLGPNGPISCMDVDGGGNILVGGTFTQWGNQTCAGLVMLNPDGELLPFTPTGLSTTTNRIDAVAFNGDGILVALPDKLLRLNRDGSAYPAWRPLTFAGIVTDIKQIGTYTAIAGSFQTLLSGKTEYTSAPLQPYPGDGQPYNPDESTDKSIFRYKDANFLALIDPLTGVPNTGFKTTSYLFDVPAQDGNPAEESQRGIDNTMWNIAPIVTA